ncbi:uncharacterized protein LOC111059254 isoform X2 [Nilaparvata lugens]|nr:uncharacterized protein LOC111059254 isoform X2 [Nilaparvata lugens]
MQSNWPGHYNLDAQPGDRRGEQVIDYNHSGGYSRRGPSTSGAYDTQGPSSSGAYVRRAPSTSGAYGTQGPSNSGAYAYQGLSTSGAYAAQGPSSSGEYVRRAPSTSGAYVTQGPSSSGAYAAQVPSSSGEYVRRAPSTSGAYAAQVPSSSGEYVRRAPSTSGAYAAQVPSSSGEYVRRAPSTSGAYVTQGPSSSGAYAAPGPSSSGAYAYQGPSTSGAYAAQVPSSSGEYVRRTPSTSGAYVTQGPSSSGAYAAPGPSSSGAYAYQGPSTTGAYAALGPSSSGAYDTQGPSSSGGYVRRAPSTSGAYAAQGLSSSEGYGPIARKLLGQDGQSGDASKDKKRLSSQEDNGKKPYKRRKSEAEEAPIPVLPGTKRLDALDNSDEIRNKLISLQARLAESPLPPEFDKLVTHLSCALCGLVGSKAPQEAKYMEPHWGSPMHWDNVHDWLTEWYQELRADEEKWENRPKAYEYEEDEAFCYVCMKPFSNADMAYDHYDSKPHERLMVNKLTNIAIRKYHEIVHFRCDICNVTSTTQAQLDVHLDSPKHAKKLRTLGINVIVPISVPNNDQRNHMKFECKICKIRTYTEETLQVHMSSAKHLRKLKKVSGEGLVDADGCGPASIFTYMCEICNVKADTYELLDIHVSSKKHKSRSEKMYGEKKHGEDKKEKPSEIRPKKPTKEYRCDICNVTANAPSQYQTHMDSPKHAKALARHLAEKRNKEKGVATASTKKQNIHKKKDEEEEDEYASSLPRPLPAATAQFLQRQNKMFNLILQGSQMPHETPIYKKAYAVDGVCGRMYVFVQRGEYMWQTLVRNQNLWKIPLTCSTNVVFGGGQDVWVGGCSLGGMSAQVQGPDMCTSRSAAAELLLHKLQSRYYQLEMPKDQFKKIDFVGNDEEEEEEEKEAEEGMMYYSDDDDDDGMEGDLSRLYVVNRDNFGHKDLNESIAFYLEDYLMNPEDFRDQVFFKCNRVERSIIKEMSADRGLIAEYRKSKEGVVVMVSKIITIYTYEPWLFLKIVDHYKHHFKGWCIVKPGTEKIGLYPTVKYIDADVF